MKKNSESIRYPGAQISPGTPDYGEIWGSDTVPLPMNNSRRHISSSALIPFTSGRTLPSKWDDAERWITSPISGHGPVRTPITHHQRRPKSKSGPLGRQGLVYLSNYSPSTPTFEIGNVSSSMDNSPLTTGVFVPHGLSVHYANSSYLRTENSISRSTEAPGLSDVLSESSAPSSQDDKLDDRKEEEALVSNVVYRRDMATQMSPEGSTISSSKGRLSFSTMTSSVPGSLRSNGYAASKDEVRDVQVDRGATTARQVKKRGPKKGKKNLNNIAPNASEAAKNTSKLQREEAKITAWENLQKAKAEASIRKLEMKLEKKRGSSMDKILNKLRSAEMKAEAMRNKLCEDKLGRTTPTASRRRISSLCINFKACVFSWGGN